jgi:hypothetical protein
MNCAGVVIAVLCGLLLAHGHIVLPLFLLFALAMGEYTP